MWACHAGSTSPGEVMDTMKVATVCLVSRLIGGEGMVFRAQVHKRTPLNSH